MIITRDTVFGYSWLKLMASEAPAKFKAYQPDAKMSSEVDIGTITHKLLLGGDRAVVESDLVRNEKHEKYKTFLATIGPKTLVVKPHEMARARAMAARVYANEHAFRLLDGASTEIPLAWEIDGLKFATRGIDFRNVPAIGWGELKTTRTSKPGRFESHAYDLQWHGHLAMYRKALRLTGPDPGPCFWIAAENKAPHVVTVFSVGEDVLEDGDRAVATWIERLKACLETDHWPGYTQAIVPAVRPAWMGERDAGEVDDEESEAAA